MSIENPTFNPEQEFTAPASIELDPAFEAAMPDECRRDPIAYFETYGQNFKTGEIKRDETGTIHEDPTAVKELPIWTDEHGTENHIVGKRVNLMKGKVAASGNPFYEYQIMESVRSVGLPAARPIARISQAETFLIFMEKVPGISWNSNNIENLRTQGFTEADLTRIEAEAKTQMLELSKQFEAAGIRRGWKLNDMILDIDIERKSIKKLVPIDWERTKIDAQQLEAYKNIKNH